MPGHELPADASTLSQEGAAEELRRVNADARSDPNHPLVVKAHCQHGDFLGRVQALYERANPAPEPGEPLDASERADAEARLRRIERVSGFADGSLRRENRSAFDRLMKERSALFERLYPEVEEVEDDTGPAPDADPAGTVLREQATAENERLVALGFEPEPLPDTVPTHFVTAMRLRRLAAEGDSAGFERLARQEMDALEIDGDPDMQADFRDGIIRQIFDAHERRGDE